MSHDAGKAEDAKLTNTADRPRQRIPYDQAAEILRQLYDELEAADSANSPEVRQVHEDNVHALGCQIIAGTVGDIQARRNAAAAISRTMIEPQAWHEATVRAGHTAIDAAALYTPTGAMQAKNVISRMLLDHPELLPPGLAYHTAVALYLSLLGDRDNWLNHRWASGGVAQQVAFAQLTSVYYHAGYHLISSLERAAAKLFPKEPNRWPALEQFRTRHSDLIGACEFARQTGIDDFAAGGPYCFPFAMNYTMDQLEALGQAPGKKAPKTKQPK